MIKYLDSKKDIFNSNCDAYVIPVSLIKCMNEGIAQDFKEEFPENARKYNQLSVLGETAIGKIYAHEVTKKENEDYEGLILFNFPIKSHPKWSSNIDYIEKGLEELVEYIIDYELKSIALPALGCDHGGLNWEPVKSLLEKHLNIDELKDIEIEIYEPIVKIQK